MAVAIIVAILALSVILVGVYCCSFYKLRRGAERARMDEVSMHTSTSQPCSRKNSIRKISRPLPRYSSMSATMTNEIHPEELQHSNEEYV